MKRFLSSLAALLMVFSLSVPILASEPAFLYKVDSSSVKPVEITLIDREITPHGRVDVYSFYIPDSGDYYEIPDFHGEYPDGSHISVEGTWEPTYARLNIMVKETEFGSSAYSYVHCNEPMTYGLWSHTEWGCFLKADGKNSSGTLRVEVT